MKLDTKHLVAAVKKLKAAIATKQPDNIRHAGDEVRNLLGPPDAFSRPTSPRPSPRIQSADLPRAQRMLLRPLSASLHNRQLWDYLCNWLCEDAPDNAVWCALLDNVVGTLDKPAKGVAGRRGYPLEALNYALELRKKNPTLTAKELRAECRKKFSVGDVPPDDGSFRRWLSRPRKNRAN